MKNKSITIEDLERRKAKVKKAIREQERLMGSTCKQTFSPLKSTLSLTENITHSFNNIVSIYQGIRMGMKVVQMFSGRSRKRK